MMTSLIERRYAFMTIQMFTSEVSRYKYNGIYLYLVEGFGLSTVVSKRSRLHLAECDVGATPK